MGRWFELSIGMDSNDTFFVTVPDFPEVTTFGDDMKSAHANGLRAIEEAIAARISDGDPLPVPLSETSGNGYFVQIPGMVYLKSALYMICKGDNVSRAELARRMNVHRNQVDRLFKLDHNSRFDQIEAAFNALKVPLNFDIEVPEAA